MSTSNTIELLQKASLEIEKKLKALEDEIVASPKLAQPPNSLDPPHIYKEKLRKDVNAILHPRELQERFKSGFEAIVGELRAQLSLQEVREIADEWFRGLEKVVPSAPAELGLSDESYDTLQERMEISEKTFEHLYQAGARLYSHQQYHQAADIFLVLSHLNYRRHNVWYSLGLCEQLSQHYDSALRAYAMASITAIEAPLPYLNSAECCLALNRPGEAKEYLEIVAEIVNNSRDENLKNHLTRLQQRCK